tara:strand:+ start:1953 stop:2264 length:312 start_codon:yes stop_codon:yes gene_type:complete
LETYVLATWDDKNLAFRLNDVKEVISGKGKGKVMHKLYNNSPSRNSAFKILTNENYLVPSETKPTQVQGRPLKLDPSSSKVLGNTYGFVSYNNGLIAVAIGNI